MNSTVKHRKGQVTHTPTPQLSRENAKITPKLHQAIPTHIKTYAHITSNLP